ncbi:MAG: cytochrome B [Boseongicola sp.]|nr:MAG: cytochrome B [Boseongicola sp.]
MWEWLTLPIDHSRTHDVGLAVSWHGRAMVIAWGVLAPLAVIVARFFKILPGQNWPKKRDSKFWWRFHWMGQLVVFLLAIIGLFLVLANGAAPVNDHSLIGYAVIFGLIVQVTFGLFRGSKGGPTESSKDGSLRGYHYDMTPRRRAFEALHKSTGYGVIVLAVVAILLGLWSANAPVWMWLALGVWWFVLILVFLKMQSRGMAVDTYQAIWGVDPSHPGNTMPHPGWWVRRSSNDPKGDKIVRRN